MDTKRQEITAVGEDAEKREPLCTAAVSSSLPHLPWSGIQAPHFAVPHFDIPALSD